MVSTDNTPIVTGSSHPRVTNGTLAPAVATLSPRTGPLNSTRGPRKRCGSQKIVPDATAEGVDPRSTPNWPSSHGTPNATSGSSHHAIQRRYVGFANHAPPAPAREPVPRSGPVEGPPAYSAGLVGLVGCSAGVDGDGSGAGGRSDGGVVGAGALGCGVASGSLRNIGR